MHGKSPTTKAVLLPESNYFVVFFSDHNDFLNWNVYKYTPSILILQSDSQILDLLNIYQIGYWLFLYYIPVCS